MAAIAITNLLISDPKLMAEAFKIMLCSSLLCHIEGVKGNTKQGGTCHQEAFGKDAV